MAPEPVVRAIIKLEGLLDERGASPAVTAALRRALDQLRTVAAGGGREAELAALRAASRALADCVAAIGASARAADRALAELTGKVQRSIDRLLGPPASMAAPPRVARPGAVVSPAVLPPRAAGPVPVSEGRAPSASPRPALPGVALPPGAPTAPGRAPPLDDVVARVPPAPVAPRPWPPPDVVARVSPAAAPARPSPSPDVVARAPAALPPRPLAPRPAVPREVGAAVPPPVERRPTARRPLAGAIAAKGERLAQGILARLSGDYDRRTNLLANPLLRWERLAEVDVPLARDGMVLAWMDPSTISVLSALVAQSDADARPTLDRALRSASPGDETVARDKLIADLDAPDDGAAIAASLALAWTGDTALAAPLLARAQAAGSDARAAALLLAAVALGSTAALAEARARVTANVDVDPHLYDALAIGGDDSDAERLLGSAARASERNAERAVLAIGHLGSARAAAALAKLVGTVAPRVVDEALEATFGDGPAGARRAAAPGRLLRGRPWSIGGVVARLFAPNEPVSSRERLALDLAVRTGLRPPVRYDPTALAARQTRAAETLRAAFNSSASALRPGDWYYFGYPVPRL